MKLKSVFIEEYKNLKNFDLKLENENFLEMFIGANGSGKSNLFEALIEIFRSIYDFEVRQARNPFKVNFAFKIQYVIGKYDVLIEWDKKELSHNFIAKAEAVSFPFPDNILIYYSGQNNNIATILERYDSLFRRRIGNDDLNENRVFIGAGSGYKNLLLAVMALLPSDNVARKFVFEKLGLKTHQKSVSFIFSRPQKTYAKDAVINEFDPSSHYWGLKGSSLKFIKKLESCIKGEFQHRDIYNQTSQSYILHIDIELFRKEFLGEKPIALFQYFDNLKALEMIASIAADLVLADDTVASFDFFSDGQFQSVYIYAISEIFKEGNCLTLLDEPDSFLHPEWQFKLLTQINEISEQAMKSNHVLMTSHSAITLLSHSDARIRYFDLKKGNTICNELPKHVAVQKLSSKLICYSEHEELLSIVRTIQVQNKPILFTEGNSDPLIINEAWRKLYQEDMPFIPYYAFTCTYINQLITDKRIHKEMAGKPVFALFDFDKAYNQWKGLNGDELESDPDKGLIKKWRDGKSFVIMLPVPQNPDIRSLVIKNEQTKTTWEDKSTCAIEHLFYGIDITQKYFIQEEGKGKSIDITFSSDKEKFAKEVVPKLSAKHFEVFRPMFEFIKQKCLDDLSERQAVDEKQAEPV